MDIETTKLIVEMQKDIKEICKDQNDLKESLRELRNLYPSQDNFNNLVERVIRIEANLSKITWIVLSAVASAVLLLVLK